MKPLLVGYVPLVDCAPLVMAEELGLYAKYGLRVRLSREIGWATIRDKIIFGKLDAAHALAAMPFAATMGQGCVACDCVTGLVLNQNGNGITLSKELWDLGVRDARSLTALVERRRGGKPLTFGVVFPSSSHHFLLRAWLRGGGVDPDQDVNIVVVPAPSMFTSLQNGNLDGYCVGEPWNTVAVRRGLGWGAATSVQLAPHHPEKVLMVRQAFSDQHPEEHLALVAAVYEACEWCDEPENRETLARVLARKRYLNVPFEVLKDSLFDSFNFGCGRVESLPDFHVFHRHHANEPTALKAAWVANNLVPLGHKPGTPAVPPSKLTKVFREDIYRAALRLVDETVAPAPVPNNENEPATALC